jgi:uncharacterized membrane protein YcaP (DUF421 family)
MDLVFRCLVLFPLVVILVRVVNRRQLHSLEPFDIVLLVVLGDLLQQGVTQNDFSVTGAAIVIVTMTLLSMLTAFAAYRSPRFSTVLDGEPVILVENGRPLHRNLRRERITARELAAQARMNNIAHLDDVHYAVLETSGAISFLTETPSG